VIVISQGRWTLSSRARPPAPLPGALALAGSLPRQTLLFIGHQECGSPMARSLKNTQIRVASSLFIREHPNWEVTMKEKESLTSDRSMAVMSLLPPTSKGSTPLFCWFAGRDTIVPLGCSVLVQARPPNLLMNEGREKILSSIGVDLSLISWGRSGTRRFVGYSL